MNVSGYYVTGICHPVKEKFLLKNMISFTRRDYLKECSCTFMGRLGAVLKKRQHELLVKKIGMGTASNHLGRHPSYAVLWYGHIAPSRLEDEVYGSWDCNVIWGADGERPLKIILKPWANSKGFKEGANMMKFVGNDLGSIGQRFQRILPSKILVGICCVAISSEIKLSNFGEAC